MRLFPRGSTSRRAKKRERYHALVRTPLVQIVYDSCAQMYDLLTGFKEEKKVENYGRQKKRNETKKKTHTHTPQTKREK